jgi:indolepyruvate ferredoxin oxidoreductase beta subunit
MQYIICGIGGQGILFATRVLGHIALSRGEHVMGSEVHGMSQRGGSVISHFKIGSYSSPLVCEGEADILLAFEQNEALRNYHFLREGGCAVVNVDRPEHMGDTDLQEFFRERSIRLFQVPGYGILSDSMEGRFLFLNSLMLGALCSAGAAGVTEKETREAIGELAPKRFREENLKAFDLGVATSG